MRKYKFHIRKILIKYLLKNNTSSDNIMLYVDSSRSEPRNSNPVSSIKTKVHSSMNLMYNTCLESNVYDVERDLWPSGNIVFST